MYSFKMLDSILFIFLVLFICLTTLVPVKDNFKHMGIHEDTDEVVLCSRDDKDTINEMKPAIIVIDHNTSSPPGCNPPITNKTSSSTVAGRTSSNNSDHQTPNTSKITTFTEIFNAPGKKITLFDGDAEFAYLGYRRVQVESLNIIQIIFNFAVTSLTPKYKYSISKTYTEYSSFLGNNIATLYGQGGYTVTPDVLDLNNSDISSYIVFVPTAHVGEDNVPLNTNVVEADSISDKNATTEAIKFIITRYLDTNKPEKTTTLYATVPVVLKTLNYNASSYTPPLS